MKSLRAGQLVTLTDDGSVAPAVISDTSHLPKVTVSVLDDEGQAVFRDVHVGRLAPRSDADEHDRALKALISAASAEERAGAPGSAGGVLKGRPAHAGPRMHRPTGR
jgi:hypothetical protein